MNEPTELDPADEGTPLIKQLRGTIDEVSKGKAEAEAQAAAAQAELARYQRAAMFDSAGIPEEGPGALLRKALEAEDDLSVEKIQSEAAAYGITAPSQGTDASQAEVEGFQMVQEANTAVPPPPPDLISQIENASSQEEVIRLAMQGGMERMYH